MNLMNRRKATGSAQDGAADAACLTEYAAARAALADDHDEAERATELLEQAAALRASTAGTVQAAQDRYAAAEQEAARILGDARRALTDAQASASKTESEAAKLTGTARSYQQAAKLAALATEALRQAQNLAAQRQDALAAADALSGRLEDLAGRQNAAQAALEAARTATDAEAAGQARQILDGIAEVTPPLTAQRDAHLARANAIGTDTTGGEYAAALEAVNRFAAERETALDAARPQRIEARYTLNPGLRLAEAVAQDPTILDAWAETWTGKTEQKPGNVVVRDAHGHVTAHGNVQITSR